MKRTLKKRLGIHLGLVFTLVGLLLVLTTALLAAPARGKTKAAPASGEPEVWVDDDFTSGTVGWGVTRTATVQGGLNLVAATGVVHVASGTYVENATITKSVQLLGEGAATTTIDGGNADAIRVQGAQDVTISGFEIRTDPADSFNVAGVSVGSSQRVTVTQNAFPEGGGVFLGSSTDGAVINNTLGDAVDVFLSDAWNSTIADNVFGSADSGIWIFDDSRNNHIVNNTLIADPALAPCTAIRIWRSSNNRVVNNTLRNFRVPILVGYSDDSIIANNTLSGNRGSDEEFKSAGIMLHHGSRHQILNNTLEGVADVGIALSGGAVSNTVQANVVSNTTRALEVVYGSDENVIRNNDIRNVETGIIVDDATDNLIYENNFRASKMLAYDGGTNTRWDDGATGNYWADYGGSGPYTIPPNGVDHYPRMSAFFITSATVPALPTVALDIGRTPALIITGTQIWDGVTIALTQPVEIAAGGQLIIHNSVLTDAVSFTLFDVQDGGALRFTDSTIRGQSGDIIQRPGAELHIEGNSLSRMGLWDGGGGILLAGDGATVRDNLFDDAYAGAKIHDGASYVRLEGNTFTRMRIGIEICCQPTTNNIIANNTLEDMIALGINATLLEDSTIVGNTIRKAWGHSFQLRGARTQIYANAVYTSGGPASEWGTRWSHEDLGNYWSDYGGVDSDDDGIGDTPYEIENPRGDNLYDDYPLMEPLPWVWTRPATGVSTDSATLQADFRVGAKAPVEVAFEYREAGNATWTETAGTSYAENGSHDQTLAGLTPDTRYEFRARLTYDGRTLTGTVHTFTPRDSAANFSARSSSGAPPLVTRFHTNGTTDPTARYRWDFGDGATSRLPEPTHIYTAGGRYTVTLTVTDTEGSATLTLSDYVYAWGNQVYLPLVLGD